MKFRSFRQRLNAAFLLASLVPTLLCSALLLQVFRIRMGSTQTQAAQQQLTAAEGALDWLSQGLQEAAQTLGRSPWVTGALLGEEGENANVNNVLFQATDALRSCAVFQLYDISLPLFHPVRPQRRESAHRLGGPLCRRPGPRGPGLLPLGGSFLPGGPGSAVRRPAFRCLRGPGGISGGGLLGRSAGGPAGLSGRGSK